MAKKDSLYFYIIDEAADLSASYASEPFTVKTLDNVGIMVSTSGVTDNTGTFTIQKRYNGYKNPSDYGPWCTMTFSSATTLADADTVHEFSMNQLNPCQLRVVFEPAGGTPDGTAQISVSGCAVGG